MITITVAGENALMIYFGEEANDEVTALVYQAEYLIRNNMPNDFIDLIPSYASILVMFDMFDIDHHQLRINLRVTLSDLLLSHQPNKLLSDSNEQSVDERIQGKLIGELVELPVYYCEQSGPDLSRMSKKANLTVEEIIQIHQAQEYRVFAIGFAPGFAYLGEVDERIAMPRLATPRLKVPKGAVAIADRQTAVYPSVSPGGWNIIGLCPIPMFNPGCEKIMPVKVGDRVKFTAISKEEFIKLGGSLPDYCSLQTSKKINTDTNTNISMGISAKKSTQLGTEPGELK